MILRHNDPEYLKMLKKKRIEEKRKKKEAKPHDYVTKGLVKVIKREFDREPTGLVTRYNNGSNTRKPRGKKK